ncbi:hypothetical protein Vretifemale_14430, partial [Volvox reticuliferus]
AAAAASGGPHKVTIWWPSQSGGGGCGGEVSGGGGAHHVTSPAVGAEIVRHPVRVLSMDWSPPLVGQRSAAAGGGSGHGSNPGSAHGGANGPGTAASAAAATAAPPHSQHLAAAPAAPSTAPALMTLGSDWVIRIYVEVVMQNMLPPDIAASTAAAGGPPLSMSQFCLTLVIEPPGLSLTPSSRPGMRACWARPLLGGGGSDVATAAVATAAEVATGRDVSAPPIASGGE